MATNSTELLLTLLAGMGLTQLPKTLKGLRGTAPPQLQEAPAAGLPQLANLELAPEVLQLLSQASGPTPAPAPAPTPAVPRYPQARARPLIPRVANMSSSLGL